MGRSWDNKNPTRENYWTKALNRRGAKRRGDSIALVLDSPNACAPARTRNLRNYNENFDFRGWNPYYIFHICAIQIAALSLQNMKVGGILSIWSPSNSKSAGPRSRYEGHDFIVIFQRVWKEICIPRSSYSLYDARFFFYIFKIKVFHNILNQFYLYKYSKLLFFLIFS